MKNVLFKRYTASAKLPTKAYNSAGYDLFPCISGIIRGGEQVIIPLGFATEFPAGFVAIIDDRGSTGNRGLNHMAGVIDSDYRGEWMIILRNHSDIDFVYGPEKAVAQVLFMEIESPEWKEVDSLGVTLRGSGKLGSSDVVQP